MALLHAPKGSLKDPPKPSGTLEVWRICNWLHSCSYNPLRRPLSRLSWLLIGFQVGYNPVRSTMQTPEFSEKPENGL